MQIGFILGFAVLGAIISSVSGFLVGNRITYILFVSFLSTLAFGGLGFGVFATLEKKVPEFLEFLSGISLEGMGSFGSSEESHDGMEGGFEAGSDGMGSDAFGVQTSVEDAAEARLAMAKSGKYGDHIIVDKIAIKNEPKLMAEAIRTMMAKDDMQEG